MWGLHSRSEHLVEKESCSSTKLRNEEDRSGAPIVDGHIKSVLATERTRAD